MIPKRKDEMVQKYLSFDILHLPNMSSFSHHCQLLLRWVYKDTSNIRYWQYFPHKIHGKNNYLLLLYMIFLNRDRFRRYYVGCFDLLRERGRNVRFRTSFPGYGKTIPFVAYDGMLVGLLLLLRCIVLRSEFEGR
jgi:hypothetical protein